MRRIINFGIFIHEARVVEPLIMHILEKDKVAHTQLFYNNRRKVKIKDRAEKKALP